MEERRLISRNPEPKQLLITFAIGFLICLLLGWIWPGDRTTFHVVLLSFSGALGMAVAQVVIHRRHKDVTNGSDDSGAGRDRKKNAEG